VNFVRVVTILEGRALHRTTMVRYRPPAEGTWLSGACASQDKLFNQLMYFVFGLMRECPARARRDVELRADAPLRSRHHMWGHVRIRSAAANALMLACARSLPRGLYGGAGLRVAPRPYRSVRSACTVADSLIAMSQSPRS
jgi:hypothetical protein